MVLLGELDELLHLGGEMRVTIADKMQVALATRHVALHGEIQRAPPLPRDPLVPLYDDAFLMSLPFD